MSTNTVQLIQDSFEQLRPRADELVTRFYERLFSEHPEVRPLFPDDMSAQKGKLAASIGLVVKNAGHLDRIEDALMDMGARHVDYGTEPAHYPVVRDTLLATMAELAGPIWSEQLHKAWSGALDAVAETMLRGAARRKKAA